MGELKEGAYAEIEKILEMGGVKSAIESGYMKSELVRSMSERMGRINQGEQVVVGVNKWQEGIDSPLLGGDDGGVFKVDLSAAVEHARVALRRPRASGTKSARRRRSRRSSRRPRAGRR